MTRKQRQCGMDPAILLVLIGVFASAPAMLSVGFQPFTAASETCMHLIRLCLAAFVPFDSVLHAAPISLLAAGVLLAAFRRMRAVWRSASLIGRIPWRFLECDEPFELIARHGVEKTIRLMLGSPPVPAFTAGLLKPRIYIAEVLPQRLTPSEIEAVLLHEVCHLRRHDPLRTLAAAVVADIFFWVPMVRNTMTAIVARLEFAADDAARASGDAVVASAIIKVSDLTRSRIAATSPFVQRSLFIAG